MDKKIQFSIELREGGEHVDLKCDGKLVKSIRPEATLLIREGYKDLLPEMREVESYGVAVRLLLGYVEFLRSMRMDIEEPTILSDDIIEKVAGSHWLQY